jgi:hypothetical protein
MDFVKIKLRIHSVTERKLTTSFPKTLRLISVKERVAVYSKNHTKPVNVSKHLLESFAYL